MNWTRLMQAKQKRIDKINENEYPIEYVGDKRICVICSVLCEVNEEGLCIHCNNAVKPLPKFDPEKRVKSFDNSFFDIKSVDWI